MNYGNVVVYKFMSWMGPHPLLWAGTQATRGKITVSGIPNLMNYCVIFIIHTLFINVVVAVWMRMIGVLV
jgi:hypothetical protein